MMLRAERTHRRRRSWKSHLAGVSLLALLTAVPGGVSVAQAPAPAATASAPAASQDKLLTREQLEALVAPIALYPDALLAQVLMASTYPLEVVQAARWSQANPKIAGKQLEDAMQQQPWDASVKSLVAVPQTLQMLNEKLDWTQKLGDAFLAQQADVLEAVQHLRGRAQAAGKLQSTKEQKVSTQQTAGKTVYVIEPTNPQVVYVPTYNPATVYGGWPYPAYPPYSYYPPGYVASNMISFGLGMAAGAALWGGCNWGNNQVNVNVNNYNSFNRSNISNSNWQHNVNHRGGVPYSNSNVARQFGRGGMDTAARDAFRGRIDSGQGLGGGPGARGGPSPSTQPARGRSSAGLDRSGRGSGGRDGLRGGSGGAFDGIGRGAQTRQESARGLASRSSSPMQLSGGGLRGGGGGGFSAGSGGFRGAGGGGFGGGGRRSDIALKHDIHLLGIMGNGLGFYRFRYIDSERTYVGVMAQEVQPVMPEAVTRGPDGYLRVFYRKLGVKFQTYKRWLASGARIPTSIGIRRSL